MQQVMNFEKVVNTECRGYRTFVNAVLVSVVVAVLAWNGALANANHVVKSIRHEAIMLDENQKMSSQQKTDIWTKQMEPQLDTALLFKAASPFSGLCLFFACCFANFLVFSKRAKAKVSDVIAKARRKEYSHLKMIGLAFAAAAVTAFLMIPATLDVIHPLGLGLFWFVFTYIGLAPFSSKQA